MMSCPRVPFSILNTILMGLRFRDQTTATGVPAVSAEFEGFLLNQEVVDFDNWWISAGRE